MHRQCNNAQNNAMSQNARKAYSFHSKSYCISTQYPNQLPFSRNTSISNRKTSAYIESHRQYKSRPVPAEDGDNHIYSGIDIEINHPSNIYIKRRRKANPSISMATSYEVPIDNPCATFPIKQSVSDHLEAEEHREYYPQTQMGNKIFDLIKKVNCTMREQFGKYIGVKGSSLGRTVSRYVTPSHKTTSVSCEANKKEIKPNILNKIVHRSFCQQADEKNMEFSEYKSPFQTEIKKIKKGRSFKDIDFDVQKRNGYII